MNQSVPGVQLVIGFVPEAYFSPSAMLFFPSVQWDSEGPFPMDGFSPSLSPCCGTWNNAENRGWEAIGIEGERGNGREKTLSLFQAANRRPICRWATVGPLPANERQRPIPWYIISAKWLWSKADSYFTIFYLRQLSDRGWTCSFRRLISWRDIATKVKTS